MLQTADTSVLRPDAKGRITLGKLAEGVSSYHVNLEKDGRIIMEPYTEIPARERWVYNNKAALKKIRAGLKDSAEGSVSSLGSFSKHLED